MERSKKSRLRGRRSRAQILPAPSPDPRPLLTQTLPRSLQKVVFITFHPDFPENFGKW